MSTISSSPATASISKVRRPIAGAIPALRNPGCFGSTRRQRFDLSGQPGGGFMKRGFVFISLLSLTLSFLACQKKQTTLNLLVWEGYADESFIKAFEQAHHCKVSASYMGSSDELVAKLRGGSASNYDVISPSSDVATSIARAGLAAPLDLSKIPSYSGLSSKLTMPPLVKANGQTFGVPFMWGPNPLLYD